MAEPGHVEAGCLFVGEYVDEGAPPADLPHGRTDVVETQEVANHLDQWSSQKTLREFTVLFNDGRVVLVRGHGLRHTPHPMSGQDVFSIVVRTDAEEVVVGVFKSGDVAGIFHGELRQDRKTA